jgi:hypothetical protein
MVDTTRRSVLKAGMALGATAALAAPSASAQTLFVRLDINSPARQEMVALYAQQCSRCRIQR